ncbi:hypothetical protein N658DRAFT_82963 [Parathielavia hyrcaniae]|uniref:Uncharacterized protein n=1 Tax=Parathielavia hyrcaniae TaxID=113614 RepID=A0AAN6T0P3_9PEZI|nr:hypothetical protein N658DRAFT_82963 [Parathielavia hyrcaniae]
MARTQMSASRWGGNRSTSKMTLNGAWSVGNNKLPVNSQVSRKAMAGLEDRLYWFCLGRALVNRKWYTIVGLTSNSVMHLTLITTTTKFGFYNFFASQGGEVSLEQVVEFCDFGNKDAILELCARNRRASAPVPPPTIAGEMSVEEDAPESLDKVEEDQTPAPGGRCSTFPHEDGKQTQTALETTEDREIKEVGTTGPRRKMATPDRA